MFIFVFWFFFVSLSCTTLMCHSLLISYVRIGKKISRIAMHLLKSWLWHITARFIDVHEIWLGLASSLHHKVQHIKYIFFVLVLLLSFISSYVINVIECVVMQMKWLRFAYIIFVSFSFILRNELFFHRIITTAKFFMFHIRALLTLGHGP